MKLFLGKAPYKHDERDLLFSSFFHKEQLPTIPDTVGHDDLVGEWGMLGNDQAGDCVIASAGHLAMLWNAMGKRPVRFTKEAILSTYTKVTGYNPDDPSTDQGTNMRDFLKYWRNEGILDADGKLHKIGAYVRMDDLTNMEHIRAAIYLFGAVNGGIMFPKYAMRQFEEGKPWTLSHGETDGGHCIPLTSVTLTIVNCITWAKKQPMEVAFWTNLADEAWIIISEEMLIDGCNMEGFGLEQLKKDLTAL